MVSTKRLRTLKSWEAEGPASTEEAKAMKKREAKGQTNTEEAEVSIEEAEEPVERGNQQSKASGTYKTGKTRKGLIGVCVNNQSKRKPKFRQRQEK